MSLSIEEVYKYWVITPAAIWIITTHHFPANTTVYLPGCFCGDYCSFVLMTPNSVDFVSGTKKCNTFHFALKIMKFPQPTHQKLAIRGDYYCIFNNIPRNSTDMNLKFDPVAEQSACSNIFPHFRRIY